MSFHNLHIPDNFLKDVTSFLTTSQNTFNMPEVLIPAAKEAAALSKKCILNEDTHRVASELFVKTMTENKIEPTETIINEFIRAVAYFSR